MSHLQVRAAVPPSRPDPYPVGRRFNMADRFNRPPCRDVHGRRLRRSIDKCHGEQIVRAVVAAAADVGAETAVRLGEHLEREGRAGRPVVVALDLQVGLLGLDFRQLDAAARLKDVVAD